MWISGCGATTMPCVTRNPPDLDVREGERICQFVSKNVSLWPNSTDAKVLKTLSKYQNE